MVSDEFNKACSDAGVEARVTPSPNPGDPFHALRMVVFKNYNFVQVRVTQFNKRKQVHIIPAALKGPDGVQHQGELTIMLMPTEELPKMEKLSA